jgi:GNAT superfamily N-acetyltransferase
MKRPRGERAVLRRATAQDLDLLVVHRRRMWADIDSGFTARELDEADPIYRRWARTRLRSGALVGWIVEIAGRAVASGCVWVQPVQPRPRWAAGRQPYLLSMFTEPDVRGRGFARRIVRAAMDWAKGEGYPRFTLHASDRGRRVYEALGWQRTWEMKVEPRRLSD